MFKNMKMKTQLNLGFMAVLILLIIVAGTAWWGLQGAFEGFSEYRQLARSSNRVADFQDEMLNVRLAVKNFVIDSDDKVVETYRQRFGAMETVLKDLKENVKNPEQAKQVALVEEQKQQYNQAFDQVVAQAAQEKDIIARLRIAGAEALNTLVSLNGQAGIDQNAVVLERTGAMLVEFLRVFT